MRRPKRLADGVIQVSSERASAGLDYNPGRRARTRVQAARTFETGLNVDGGFCGPVGAREGKRSWKSPGSCISSESGFFNLM